MKIVIAIDSLKGSLSSIEAGTIIKDAILSIRPADITLVPLADGGEGTVEALVSGLNGQEIKIPVTGPLGETVTAAYGILPQQKTAVIEMAAAAGLTLVPEEQRNPMNTTTYGLGELILDAARRGCRDFIIGIGGSATNDGGIGMLQALGAEFYCQDGSKAGPYGKDVLSISEIRLDHLDPVLKECTFRIACDVKNPLCGPSGCSAVYGPQKGAIPELVQQMDDGLLRFSKLVKDTLGIDAADAEGAGAAGGLGYAFLAFLNGRLQPGISLILDYLDFETLIQDADIVITGEGKMDRQTAMGKAPVGVARAAKKKGAKVLAFVGGATPDAEACNAEGIDAYFPIMQLPMSVSEAMDSENVRSNLTLTVRQVFRLISLYEQ